ncbi:MAG: hypothetical protein HY399_03310 [Elusimicrobia bacterium]|nr:hypothetical protein [Elusimicrobiota bacterium]
MVLALALGAGLGFLNGLFSRWSLSWAIGKSDKLFYGVWTAGFLYRILFVAFFIALLFKYPIVPMVPALMALVVGQFVPQIFPIPSKNV